MRIFHLFFYTLILFLFSQCTLDRINGSSNITITEEDLEAATLILGDAITKNSGGIFLSVQDAIAIVSGQGFSAKVVPQNHAKSKFTYTPYYDSRYDPETGTHIVTFERWGQNKMDHEQDSLNYVYRDAEGNFVKYPTKQRELIETVSYSGFKKGSISEGEYIINADGRYEFITTKLSKYTRNSNFFFSTNPTKSNTIPLEGNHIGNGFIEYPKTDLENLSRYYEISMDFLNIQLKLSVSESHNVEADLRASVATERDKLALDFIGGLSWEMKTWSTPEQLGSPVIASGTMSFKGDGQALIRFENSNESMLIDIVAEPDSTDETKPIKVHSTDKSGK